MIELPFPAKILWPNGRGHHMKKHRLFQSHKQWAYAATLADNTRPSYAETDHIHWFVTIYPKTANAIDIDNAAAAMKAYQDGIALALKVNDRQFGQPSIHFGEPVKNGRVVVTLA